MDIHLHTSIQMQELLPEHYEIVLNLIRADLLPGQPLCQLSDLKHALLGEATVDSNWWEALTTPRAMVAIAYNQIVGAASYGVRKEDGAGFLLWLHAQEHPAVVDALLEAVLLRLSECPSIYAFWFATPLTLGVEAFPVRHRAITHELLLAHGFEGKDEWLYMLGSPTSKACFAAQVTTWHDGWQLTIHNNKGQRIAEAEVGLGPEQIGVLWWLWVHEEYRGRSLGKQLLQQARYLLGQAGARQIILYVDHDDPQERNRVPAIRLYQAQGFVEVDHLWSYKKAR